MLNLKATTQSINKAPFRYSRPLRPPVGVFSFRKHDLLGGSGYRPTATRTLRVQTGIRASALIATNNGAPAVIDAGDKEPAVIAGPNNGAPAVTATNDKARAVIPATTNEPSLATNNKTSIRVRALITVRLSHTDVGDGLGQTLVLELVGAELDPETGLVRTIKGYARDIVDEEDGTVKYEANFVVPPDFGEVGAMNVTNKYKDEMYLVDIVLNGFPSGPLHFTGNSWLQPQDKRIFFTNKSYLPSQTPSGLRELRQNELENLRGDGTGERIASDRIYDYDVYNDLGDPDKDPELKRPVLGGDTRPYPRRCRTGRGPCDTDPLSEKKTDEIYVPRDEQYSDVKKEGFKAKSRLIVLRTLLPAIEEKLEDAELSFPHFTAIGSLYDVGIAVPGVDNIIGRFLPEWLRKIVNKVEQSFLRFDPPALFKRDRFSWTSDGEFARQTVAGINPLSIKLVKEWPLKSELPEEIYGPAESAITRELIESQMRGLMTIEEAIEQKRLFILDYHDTFLPYVNLVREVEGTTLYGSRTLFFRVNNSGTLQPIAIELTRPPNKEKPQWKKVFTPSWESTNSWLWRIAKAHVIAHDSGHHQLISHWLRTHACTEPYIIATNRQLSVMHPIYRLLSPHFRYTMQINANGRETLASADGIIETTGSPRKYCIELSSYIYGKQWRFDHEALPVDLVNRGMAFAKDPSKPYEDLELTIPDYPYASDGLILWDAMKQWVKDYVDHYYPEASLVESDDELQAWWEEIRTVGHGDKKNEPWWPILKTPEDLTQILTTIIWVASAHHAAVNFGQYDYAGYIPNKPTIARIKMPSEDPIEEEWKSFVENPEKVLLDCFPSQVQAAKVMATLDLLSTHSADEEFLGKKSQPAWEEEPAIKEAFQRFQERLTNLERTIDERNKNINLKNRNGVGILPYELLKPTSRGGDSAKGVPNSITI